MATGYLFIICAAVCWGFIGIFSALAFTQGISPMEVAFWRAGITWLCFGTQAVIRKETGCDSKDLPLFVFFGLFGVTLFYFVYLSTVKTGGAAFAAVLLYTAPMWVILTTFLLHRKPPELSQLISVGLVIVGVFFISKSGGNANADVPFSFLAVITGLTAGFCYSLYYTVGKYFSAKYSSANLFLYILPVGVLGLLPFVNFAHKTPIAWTAIVLVSVLSTFIPNFCYYKSLKYLEPGSASIIATVEPVVAAVAAFVLFEEYFTLSGYLGAGAILIAVLMTIKTNNN